MGWAFFQDFVPECARVHQTRVADQRLPFVSDAGHHREEVEAHALQQQHLVERAVASTVASFASSLPLPT